MEYMVDAGEFAIALNQAHVVVTLLVATYNAINLLHTRASQHQRGRNVAVGN